MLEKLRVLALALVLAACSGAETGTHPTADHPQAFEHFITVDGPELMNGDEPFRFISFNVPTLLYVEDEMAFDQTNPYRLPTEFELRDVFESVRQMGGQVVRAYTIPVRNTNFPPESVTYVEAPGVFNEEAFRAMDMAIALAAEYEIRLVIPLVNNWEWMGGRPNYAAFRGLESDAFWTDRQLIEDFKLTIEHVLGRVNTVTGIPYRDDPTIMAWETGNELQNPPEWGIEITRYMRSLDPNHLIIDGFHAIHTDGHHVWVQPYSIEEPSIDLINTHHYETSATATIENLRRTVEMVGGRKPVFVGEFGFISTSGVEDLLDYVIEEPAISGALIWSLRRHHPEGGFYHHSEPIGHGLYRAYHWPGFDDGAAYDERNLLALMRDRGFAIQGLNAPPLAPPQAPNLLPFDEAPVFSWQGAAGAAGYDVERARTPDGDWQQIAYNVDDIETPGFALFTDEGAVVGEPACYRIRARNAAGLSGPSNTRCLETVDHLMRADRARNIAVLHQSNGISVRTGENRSFKEAFSRLHGEAGAQIVYRVPGIPVSMRIYAYETDLDPDLSLSASLDGVSYHPVSARTEAYASSEENYAYRVPVLYTLDLPSQPRPFVKLDFDGTVDIVRVEMDYR